MLKTLNIGILMQRSSKWIRKVIYIHHLIKAKNIITLGKYYLNAELNASKFNVCEPLKQGIKTFANLCRSELIGL